MPAATSEGDAKGAERLPADDGGGGDRISVTDVNGTVARFEMAYSPAPDERIRFGPPVRQWIPSIGFLLFALGMVGAVLLGQAQGTSSPLGRWIFEQDRGRPIGSLGLSIIVLLSALGTLVRAQMRGVVVHADGVEGRYLLPFGIPKVKKWAWPEVERIVLDHTGVMFELWNGQYERLPDVKDGLGLRQRLEGVAAARKIRVTRLPHL